MAELPDFDTLKWLAEHDPVKLAQLQESLTEEIINNSQHNRAQLRSLHHHYKEQMKRCTNPYHRCVVSMALMRGKLFTMAAAINSPDEFTANLASVTPIDKKLQ
ncbi:DUF3135 domain-containing protein [Shewanella sp. GXUN23E]|uniref:DUF3135 domain-containing protein n=1 Tax=Shewanella sp. GXUN23E TaxID=3422498 RepID=UPI003D7CCF09